MVILKIGENMISDYDLVSIAKTGNKKASEELFFRYKPFVNKHFTKIKKEVHGVTLDSNDFLSEAYFEFLKALKYTNLEKVYDSTSWKFLGVYGYFLNGLRKRLRTEVLRKGELETSLTWNSEDESIEEDIPDHDSLGSQQEKELEEKDMCKRFYESLTKDELKVLKERTKIKEKGKPMTLMDIAAKLQCSFSKVQELNKSLEMKFQTYTNYA